MRDPRATCKPAAPDYNRQYQSRTVKTEKGTQHAQVGMYRLWLGLRRRIRRS